MMFGIEPHQNFAKTFGESFFYSQIRYPNLLPITDHDFLQLLYSYFTHVQYVYATGIKLRICLIDNYPLFLCFTKKFHK